MPVGNCFRAPLIKPGGTSVSQLSNSFSNTRMGCRFLGACMRAFGKLFVKIGSLIKLGVAGNVQYSVTRIKRKKRVVSVPVLYADTHPPLCFQKQHSVPNLLQAAGQKCTTHMRIAEAVQAKVVIPEYDTEATVAFREDADTA